MKINIQQIRDYLMNLNKVYLFGINKDRLIIFDNFITDICLDFRSDGVYNTKEKKIVATTTYELLAELPGYLADCRLDTDFEEHLLLLKQNFLAAQNQLESRKTFYEAYQQQRGKLNEESLKTLKNSF